MIDIDNIRLIFFHKHPVSARMHFLYFPHGSVCAFKSLPKLASLSEKTDSSFVIHPSTISNWAEQQLGLYAGALQVEAEFCERVEVPNGEVTVYLTGFNGYETPDESQSRVGAKFVTLMECVGIPPVEMLLLQKAYRVIMGG